MRTSQTETVEIAIPRFWCRLLRRPIAFYSVAALTGVSITFVPLALFQLGRSGAFGFDWRVLGCFFVVYMVPLVYIRLGGPVLNELWKGRGVEGRPSES